jgi:hypothetical protein
LPHTPQAGPRISEFSNEHTCQVGSPSARQPAGALRLLFETEKWFEIKIKKNDKESVNFSELRLFESPPSEAVVVVVGKKESE